jgi:hypothetical protein
MHGSDRCGDLVTTDLLSEWTDPDTAMEAVGTSLGIFDDRVANSRTVLSSDTPLRNALYAVLLSLVEGGALEMRPCGGARYAFRWRADIESAVVGSPPPIAQEEPASAVPVVPAVAIVPVHPVVRVLPDAPVIALEEQPAARARRWPRILAATAPLGLPALSCVLALLAFVWLDPPVALVIAGLLILAGVIGLIRRVPFAGLWTVGVIIAGLLLRLS